MKLCKDCKHLTRISMCVSPSNPVSPVDGKPQPYFATLCRTERSSLGNGCGPEAKHFEAKGPSTKTVRWWDFWRRGDTPAICETLNRT